MKHVPQQLNGMALKSESMWIRSCSILEIVDCGFAHTYGQYEIRSRCFNSGYAVIQSAAWRLEHLHVEGLGRRKRATARCAKPH